MNSAMNPIDSMNQLYGNIKYVIIDPINQRASTKSKYDWKSVHAQKYFRSKSVHGK